MNELFRLIDERIKKYNDNATLKSVPCKILSIDNEYYTVALIENNATYKVLNRSGARAEVGDNVSLYYHGDIINSNNAYIGAVIYRPDNSESPIPELDVIYGDSYTGDLSNHDGVTFTLYVMCEQQTNCLFLYSVNANSSTQGEITLSVYVDGEEHPFSNTTTIVANGKVTPALNLPLILNEGVHEVWVVGSGTGIITGMNGCLMGHGIKSPFVKTVSNDYDYTILNTYVKIDRYNNTDILNPMTIDSIDNKPVTNLGSESFENLDVKQVYISDDVEVVE